MWFNGVFADRSAQVSAACADPDGHGIGQPDRVGADRPSILWLSVLFICLAMGGALSYDGPFWAAGSRALPPVVVGGAMGLINALGNLGGYLGPFLGGYLQQTTGGFLWHGDIAVAARCWRRVW